MIEREIFERAKLGNKEAFAQIFDKELQRDMYVIAKVKLNNIDDCKDAIQETMLELFKNIKNIKNFEKLKPWILKVLVNKCNNIFRHNHRFETYECGAPIHFEAENQIEYIDNRVDVFNLLNCLEPEEKELITLYYIDQHTALDMVKMVGMNEDTIRTKIKRAMDKLRKMNGRGDI